MAMCFRKGKRKLIMERKNTWGWTDEKVDNLKDAKEDLPLARLPGFAQFYEEEGRPPMEELVEKNLYNSLVNEDVKRAETRMAESKES